MQGHRALFGVAILCGCAGLMHIWTTFGPFIARHDAIPAPFDGSVLVMTEATGLGHFHTLLLVKWAQKKAILFRVERDGP